MWKMVATPESALLAHYYCHDALLLLLLATAHLHALSQRRPHSFPLRVASEPAADGREFTRANHSVTHGNAPCVMISGHGPSGDAAQSKKM